MKILNMKTEVMKVKTLLVVLIALGKGNHRHLTL
jgi:hypothetical protein